MLAYSFDKMLGGNLCPPPHPAFILLLIHLLYLLGDLADLHVHQQVGLLNDIHHLANLLYHHHHYNRGIVPRGALHN